MRRICVCFLLCLCTGGAFAYNESVAAISYNPSRLGAYQYLKAVQKATLGGGLRINSNATMNVQAGTGTKTVSLTDNDPANECANSKCSIDPSDGNINQITTIKPAGNANEDVTTKVNSSVILQKISNTPITNYEYNGTSQPSADNGTNVTMEGGALEASNDSFINQLTVTAEKLNIKAETSIQIEGDAEATKTLQLGTITLVPSNNDKLTWKDYSGSQVLGYQ